MKAKSGTRTKKTDSIAPAIRELERFFSVFNRKLYDGKLPKPVITIQTTGRRRALGWFCANIWRAKEGEVPEINITAEELGRDVEDILETLLHEMVHLDNWTQGISDCSVQQYHNKRFKVACDKIGLNCERTKHGWSLTSLTPALKALIRAAKPQSAAFKMFRLSFLPGAKAASQGTRLKKWSCGCTNVRVAVADFDAVCNNCGGHFEECE